MGAQPVVGVGNDYADKHLPEAVENYLLRLFLTYAMHGFQHMKMVFNV